MSWKSLVTAGLLCVVASPVFAAPGLTVTSGGLNAQGNWVWNVQVSSSLASTPLATELGFKSNQRDLMPTVGATRTNPGTNFDNLNPGNPIFAWQVGALLDASSNNKPTGIQTQCPTGNCSNDSRTLPGSVAGPGNEVFAALGSIDFPTAGAHDFIQIVTAGPTNAALTNSITVSGKYGAGSNEGLIAELDTPTTAKNYRLGTANTTATRTIVNGDINLSGVVDNSDFGIFAGAFGTSTTGNWAAGDFNRSGAVDNSDFGIFAGAFNPAAPPGGTNTPVNLTGILIPGAGSGAAVPEPASIALMGLALLAGLGLVRRRS